MALRTLVSGACLAALVLGGTGAVAQDRPASLESVFRAPPAEARPRVRWWWPGAAVDPDELRREIALLDEQGFGGAEIQSLTPNFVTLTPQERAVVNDYAEPSFFALVKVAAAAAAARGMTLDYTLGSSWPSGGGFAITPEKAFVELTMARTEIAGGTLGPIRVTVPARTRRLGALGFFDARVRDPAVADWGKRLDARAGVVAVVAMKGTAPELKPTEPSSGFKLYPWHDVAQPGTLDTRTALLLTDKLHTDGTLDWRPPPGTWQVFVFKKYASDMGVPGAAGRGPQLVLDHMNPMAFAAHAARVAGPLGDRPAGIRSTFVDSLELMQDLPWSERFLAEFRSRRGYDLTPYLPLVLQPGWMQAWDEHWSPPYFGGGDLGDRVRADYRRTVSDLMFEGFVKPFAEWNRARGLKSKFQAHGGAIDIVRGYGIVDIPETEDLVHGGDPFVMRFARSGADLYGRRIVSAESLVWGGRPYDVTPDEMRQRADLLFAGGVNSMILHGFDYRFHADDWPGWHAFQPSPFGLGFSTMFTETNPIWPAVKPLARYIARTQAVLQAGVPVVPVAYFYGQTGYYVGIEDAGAGKQAAEKVFLAGGYDFDRINPDSIAGAHIEQRQLVSRGGQRYSALVLPPIDGLRAETAEAIAGFAKAGLPVLFTDHAPRRDEGLADAQRRDARVVRAIAAAQRAGARVVPTANITAALRAARVPANLAFTGTNPSDLYFVQRRTNGRTVTFVHNGGSGIRDAGLVLPGIGGVTRWNAMDGSSAPVSAEAEHGGTRVALTLRPGQSALLVQDSRTRPQRIAARVAVGRAVLPAEGWTLAVEGHVSRKPFKRDMGEVMLKDWRSVPELANFAGTATYRRSVSVDPGWLARAGRVTIDLGEVHDMAILSVNGRTLAPAIGSPFRIDVTGLLVPGVNELVVTVANTPQNAMLDSKTPGYKALKAVPAGLVGPVALEGQR